MNTLKTIESGNFMGCRSRCRVCGTFAGSQCTVKICKNLEYLSIITKARDPMYTYWVNVVQLNNRSV